MKRSRLHGGKRYKLTAKRIMPFDSGLRLTRELVEDMGIGSGIMDTLLSRMLTRAFFCIEKPYKVK